MSTKIKKYYNNGTVIPYEDAQWIEELFQSIKIMNSSIAIMTGILPTNISIENLKYIF